MRARSAYAAAGTFQDVSRPTEDLPEDKEAAAPPAHVVTDRDPPSRASNLLPSFASSWSSAGTRGIAEPSSATVAAGTAVGIVSPGGCRRVLRARRAEARKVPAQCQSCYC